MKSKKKSDEKAQVIEIEIEGNLEDLLTEEANSALIDPSNKLLYD